MGNSFSICIYLQFVVLFFFFISSLTEIPKTLALTIVSLQLCTSLGSSLIFFFFFFFFFFVSWSKMTPININGNQKKLPMLKSNYD